MRVLRGSPEPTGTDAYRITGDNDFRMDIHGPYLAKWHLRNLKQNDPEVYESCSVAVETESGWRELDKEVLVLALEIQMGIA